MTQKDNTTDQKEKGDHDHNNKNSSTIAVQQNNNNQMQNTSNNNNAQGPERTGLHLLQTEWTLWLYTNNKAKSWDENLQKVISFNVVEDFWAVYNHIQLASKLNAGHDYALFRAGTRPAWEDEANKVGGRWIVSLPSKHYRKNDLDRLLVWGVLGFFESSIFFSIRRQDTKNPLFYGSKSSSSSSAKTSNAPKNPPSSSAPSSQSVSKTTVSPSGQPTPIKQTAKKQLANS